MKSFTSLMLLLAILLPATGHTTATCPSAKTEARGTIQVQESQFFALTRGVVMESPYRTGDLLPAGKPLLDLWSMDISNRLIDLDGQQSFLDQRMVDVRNASIVNRASLDEYEKIYGPLSPQARQRALREDERQKVEATTNAILVNRRKLNEVHRRTNGIFPYPILLLADPIRASETVQAGAPLARYIPLDRLSVLVYSTANTPAPSQMFLPLSSGCLKLDYLRTVLDSKSHNVQWVYQGKPDKQLTADVASTIRAQQAFLRVLY